MGHQPASKDLPGAHRSQDQYQLPMMEGRKAQAGSAPRSPTPFAHPTTAASSLETALAQLQWDLQDGMSEAQKHHLMPLIPSDGSIM